MTSQDLLVEILKHKGIGPNGSKTLHAKDISNLPSLLEDSACELVTKATLLTAILLLDKSEAELVLIERIKERLSSLPKQLTFLFSKKAESYREEIILELIERKDLNKEGSEKAIASFFDQECPAFLTAAFLEGERLKRETTTENIAFYDYFLNQSKRIELDCEPIIEIGDSFDGVNRNNNYNLFTACVLGTLGYKVTLTGNETVAPKFGNTHHQILAVAGKNPTLAKEQLINQINNFGWCYLDQSVFHKEMFENREMRKQMVKRPFIATFEKIASPLVSKNGNYIITSYTHAHYQNANIEILKNNPFCIKAINIKGLEGTIQPKSNISTVAMVLDEAKNTTEIKHSFIGDTYKDTEVSIEETLAQGISFLEHNTNNEAKNYVINSCTVILKHFNFITDEKTILNSINHAINSGTVFKYWKNSHNTKY